MKRIPIAAARDVAERYGYDQVVIIARKVGPGGGEHCTTYGVDKANCAVAARIGDFLKHQVMGWAEGAGAPPADPASAGMRPIAETRGRWAAGHLERMCQEANARGMPVKELVRAIAGMCGNIVAATAPAGERAQWLHFVGEMAEDSCVHALAAEAQKRGRPQ
jgi:hypothetical protein